ncbi:glutathione S-transferase [Ideonella sp.]|uniref:glutathione S-transferase n=1 Tax=Ideonella sp. TaxID=1929293 RepID=UPI0039C86B42
MPLPLLYTYRRCPYAMRARMALLQARVPFQACEIVLRDKPVDLLRLSPKGTVPVLLLPDGQVIDESWDIMRWALEPRDRDGWWHRAQSTENLALLHANDGDFKRYLDHYKYPQRYPDETQPREALRSLAVEVLLTPLEQRLQSRPHLGGDAPCATDLAIFPFVRQFAAVEPGWFEAQELPALKTWLAAWLGSELFAVGMTKPFTAEPVFGFPSLT